MHNIGEVDGDPLVDSISSPWELHRIDSRTAVIERYVGDRPPTDSQVQNNVECAAK